MKLTKKERETLFHKYNGRCAYCGCELVKGWHADHIEAIVRDFTYNKEKSRFQQTGKCLKPENQKIENFNPSCAKCNILKNSNSLEEFRRIIKQFVNSLNLYSTQYKFAKKYGLVQETGLEVVFYFETLNKLEDEKL